jgi:hypothetical protein
MGVVEEGRRRQGMTNGKQAPSGSTPVVFSQTDAFGFFLLAPESSRKRF